jgi:hypothetical protein
MTAVMTGRRQPQPESSWGVIRRGPQAVSAAMRQRGRAVNRLGPPKSPWQRKDGPLQAVRCRRDGK